MSETAWLKQVLDDAKAAKQDWPDWAKDSSVQTELNSHPDDISEPPASTLDANAAKSDGNGDLKLI